GSLEVSGAISGSNANSLNKSGTGDLRLSGSNAYTGATNVSEGTVTAANTNAFGTTAAGVVVQQQAAVQLDNVSIGNEALTLNAFLDYSPNGGLRNLNGNNTWGTGTTAVSVANSFTGINVNAGTQLTLNATVSGTGLTKLGDGA